MRTIHPRARLAVALTHERGVGVVLASLFLPLVAYNFRHQGVAAGALALVVPVGLLVLGVRAALADLRQLRALAVGVPVRVRVVDREGRPGFSRVRHGEHEAWIPLVESDDEELDAVADPADPTRVIVPAQLAPRLRVTADAVTDDSTRVARGLQLLALAPVLGLAAALAIALA
jgi:hypothetical protein